MLIMMNDNRLLDLEHEQVYQRLFGLLETKLMNNWSRKEKEVKIDDGWFKELE